MNLIEQFIGSELGLDPSRFMSLFGLYNQILMDWNSKINLISRKSDSIEEQILNSIFFIKKYDFSKFRSLVDIGTGGGFPGIPLKILFPEINLLLVDSIRKKVNVLEDIIFKMKLNCTKAVWGRAEELSIQPAFEKAYDCVISKSVADIDMLYQWGKNFLNESGVMLSIKGGDLSNELSELKNSNYNINVDVIEYSFDDIYGIEDKKLIVINHI